MAAICCTKNSTKHENDSISIAAKWIFDQICAKMILALKGNRPVMKSRIEYSLKLHMVMECYMANEKVK